MSIFLIANDKGTFYFNVLQTLWNVTFECFSEHSKTRSNI